MNDQKPHPLEYRTPPAPAPDDHSPRSAVGCLGVILGVFGMFFLIAGIRELLHVFNGMTKFLRSDHAAVGAISLVIGLFCLFIAARWLRHAWGNRERK